MKISVITATYNSESSVTDAVQSVLSQSYDNIQYVIIDGASKDKTLSLVQEELKDSKVSHKIISEPDEGIYDALNKGIANADGDVIGFLHADDLYYDKDVLAKVAEKFSVADNSLDSVYGDLQYVQKDNTDKIVRLWKSGLCTKKSMKRGWMPPHPAFFVKKAVYDKYGCFDKSFRIAADYDFMMRVLYKEGISTAYLPEVLVKMRLGGASNKSLKNICRKSKEDLRAMKKNNIGGAGALLLKNIRKTTQFIFKN